MYWKLSMLITSMIGHTTRLLSSTTRASKGSSQSWVSCQLLLTKGKLITLLGSLCWISYQLLLTKAKFFTLLHSQCESRKVRMPEVAASAPFTLDLIRPSRLSFRRTRTFWIVESSSPSAAAIARRQKRLLTMVSTNTYFLSGKSSFAESFFSLLILILYSNLK